MVGIEVFEEVDVGESVRTGRLVLSRKWGADYDAAAIAWGVALMSGLLDIWAYRSRGIALTAAVLLLSVGAVWFACRLFVDTTRSYDFARVPVAGASKSTRDAFTRVADALGWEKNRNNGEYGRYFLDRYVVTVIFRPDVILLNCRRTCMNRNMRVPISKKERDEIVRVVSSEVDNAMRPSNPRPEADRK
jgi:hypothetical protein